GLEYVELRIGSPCGRDGLRRLVHDLAVLVGPSSRQRTALRTVGLHRYVDRVRGREVIHVVGHAAIGVDRGAKLNIYDAKPCSLGTLWALCIPRSLCAHRIPVRIISAAANEADAQYDDRDPCDICVPGHDSPPLGGIVSSWPG